MQNRSKIQALCANNCGRSVGRLNQFYCSNACHVANRKRLVIAAFKAGTYIPRMQMHRAIRQYLIATLGEHCQRCGWAERHERTGRVPLEIEHIDGNWRNCAEGNLTVLCPNCHSLTPTFRNFNRGNGRPGRPGLTEPNEPRKFRGKHKPISYLIAG